MSQDPKQKSGPSQPFNNPFAALSGATGSAAPKPPAAEPVQQTPEPAKPATRSEPRHEKNAPRGGQRPPQQKRAATPSEPFNNGLSALAAFGKKPEPAPVPPPTPAQKPDAPAKPRSEQRTAPREERPAQPRRTQETRSGSEQQAPRTRAPREQRSHGAESFSAPRPPRHQPPAPVWDEQAIYTAIAADRARHLPPPPPGVDPALHARREAESRIHEHALRLMFPPPTSVPLPPTLPPPLPIEPFTLGEGPLMQIMVGVDFGSALTKVAWANSADATGPITPLLFPHAESVALPACCLPSLVVVTAAGDLNFGTEALAARAKDASALEVTNLRSIVAGRYSARFRREHEDRTIEDKLARTAGLAGLTPDHLTALYLVHVMEQAALFISFDPAVRGSQLDFAFNVSMPLDYAGNRPVVDAFERILALTQYLFHLRMKNRGVYTWRKLAEEALTRWLRASYEIEDLNTRIFFVEETAALIAGFRETGERASGIHAVVDIGAGSTAVAILELSGEEKCETLAAANVPIGFSEVLRRLREGTAGRPPMAEIERQLLSGAYESVHHRERIAAVLVEIFEVAIHVWRKAKRERPSEALWARDAAAAAPRVHLSGAAADQPLVRHLFERCWVDYLHGRSEGWGPYASTVMASPAADRYAPEGAPYHRMAVACGLARIAPKYLSTIDTKVLPFVRKEDITESLAD